MNGWPRRGYLSRWAILGLLVVALLVTMVAVHLHDTFFIIAGSVIVGWECGLYAGISEMRDD